MQGNRIRHVGRGSRTVPTIGPTVIDGAGATLMPGMFEAHTHFSWNNSATLDAISACRRRSTCCSPPTWRKTYLDMGWTTCVGAAAPSRGSTW